MNYREMMAERVSKLMGVSLEDIEYAVRKRATKAMHTELVTQDTMKQRYGNGDKEYIIKNGVVTFI
jgi:hypothetical protein